MKNSIYTFQYKLAINSIGGEIETNTINISIPARSEKRAIKKLSKWARKNAYVNIYAVTKTK